MLYTKQLSYISVKFQQFITLVGKTPCRWDWILIKANFLKTLFCKKGYCICFYGTGITQLVNIDLHLILSWQIMHIFMQLQTELQFSVTFLLCYFEKMTLKNTSLAFSLWQFWVEGSISIFVTSVLSLPHKSAEFLLKASCGFLAQSAGALSQCNLLCWGSIPRLGDADLFL